MCAFLAMFMLCVAVCFEIRYRQGLQRLPSLVNEQGETASLAAAIAGMDMYEQVKRERTFATVFLGVAVLLGVCAAVTTSQKQKIHDA